MSFLFRISGGTRLFPNLSDLGLDRVVEERLANSFSKDFYFVHSYVGNLDDMSHALAYFDHPDGYQVAAIHRSNVYGFQFHPEKSGSAGYDLIRSILL